MAAVAPAPLRTTAQNRAIWGLVSRIAAASGLSRDELAPMVQNACKAESGQEHTGALTAPQAQRVIQRLQRELDGYAPREVAPIRSASEAPPRLSVHPEPAPHVPWGPRQVGPRESLPMTPFQGVVLGGLFRLCEYTDLRKQRAFCERQTGKSWPTTQTEADAVITPLSAMALRKVDAEDIRARVAALGKVRLDRWKTGFVADLARQLEERPGKAALSPHKLLKVLECEAAAGIGGGA